MPVLAAGFLLICLVLNGCNSKSSVSPDAATQLPTTTMPIGGEKFILEKAVTPGQQEKGLMLRDGMAADHGMIFIFPASAEQHFWNHDVRFGLDNVFLDDNGKIVSIQQMRPYDEQGTTTVFCRYVIELNIGTAENLGLKPGDTLAIPGDAR